MANDMNLCSFIGRLGADPETRVSPAGLTMTNFRIAVGWKTKDKEGTEWVPISTFGKLAEICHQYLRKGSQVQITGRFRTREWVDKDGNKRSRSEINADSMQMLGGKPDHSEPKAYVNDAGQPAVDFDDDIPF